MSLLNIVRLMKTKTISWNGLVAHRGTCEIQTVNLFYSYRGRLISLVDMKIILKYVRNG